jgi:hypothetical protein
MPDELDKIEERDAPLHEAWIGEVRARAAAMPVGRPGECDLCGEWSGRLVNGACAPCRDRRGLP